MKVTHPTLDGHMDHRSLYKMNIKRYIGKEVMQEVMKILYLAFVPSYKNTKSVFIFFLKSHPKEDK